MGPKVPVSTRDLFRYPLNEQINMQHPLVRLAGVISMIVDITVMEKAITYPTDSKLLARCQKHLVKAATEQGLKACKSPVASNDRSKPNVWLRSYRADINEESQKIRVGFLRNKKHPKVTFWRILEITY